MGKKVSIARQAEKIYDNENLFMSNGHLERHRDKFPQSAHNAVCDNIWKSILNGTDLWIEIHPEDLFKEQDAESCSDYCNCQDEKSPHMAVLSVLTQAMLHYDRTVFRALEEIIPALDGDDSITEYVNYRPYFFLFSCEVNALAKVLPSNKLTEPVWLKAHSVDDEGDHNVDERHIVGEFISATSPLKRERRTIQFDEDVLSAKKSKEIKDTYLVAQKARKTPNSIRSLLENEIGHTTFGKATIFSVGVGNFICIDDSNRNRSILFDVGWDPKEEQTKNHRFTGIGPNASNWPICKQLTPCVVVLSHWDLDHILGCTLLNQSVFEAPWVAPDFDGIGYKIRVGASRLAKLLACYGKLNLLNMTSAAKYCVGMHIPNTNLTVFQGQYNSSDFPNKQNQTGLIVAINGVRKRMNPCRNASGSVALFFGDSPYSSSSRLLCASLLDQCLFLAVPHHCSKMDVTPLSQIKKERRFAVSCTRLSNMEYIGIRNGTHPEYKNRSHPAKTDEKHLRSLNQSGYLVFPTGEADISIELNLNTQTLVLHDYSKKNTYSSSRKCYPSSVWYRGTYERIYK